ncbi:phospholipid-translocating ATPase [Fusarium austroafricanum]|uniref:Phospholipid-transporting ATPase n=1 Tax=Fusarium austroafricanum TaxID=2364996 RepID=A0A8H4JS17_9HYPO|nr:phospholipid-translocating ATPase [Fusarium austroafricanum]
MAPYPSDNNGRRPFQPRSGNDSDVARDLAALDEQYPPTSTNFSRLRNSRRSYTDPNNDRPPRRSSNDDTNTRSGSRSRSRRADDGLHRRASGPYELQPIPSRTELYTDLDGAPDSAHPTDKSLTSPIDKTSLGYGANSSGSKSSVRADIKKYLRERREKKIGPGAKPTWKDRTRKQLSEFHQKVILETILRQKPLEPLPDGRHIPLNPTQRNANGLIDERAGKPYISNFIRSSRYTIYDFFFKQLIFQFSKLGNFYFLVVGSIQLIPGLSTVGTWTTIAPLAVFVAFSMAKEGWDDYRRYRLDRIENRSEAWILADRTAEKGRIRHAEKMRRRKEKVPENGEEHMLDDLETGTTGIAKVGGDGDWTSVQWQNVRVGDVIRLRRDDPVPADIVLLHATGPNGIAYIDTMALDGETNLKSKQACPLLAERCNTLEGLRATHATVISENPNLDLYSYDGRVTVDGETLPLSMNNVVYRGSTLRNTAEALGVIVNTGEECKIRMNANKNVRAKKPAMQSVINRMILFQIFIVLMLTMGLTIGYYLWRDRTEDFAWYIRRSGFYNGTVPFKEIFFGFIIMFNTLIPLSLYISLEIIKLGQLYLLQDSDMYDPISDTPMVANTTTILENLGQVSYVFSDKTGTLTENIMRFRKMSVAGVACLHDMDVQRDQEELRRRIEESERPKKGKSKMGSLSATKSPGPGKTLDGANDDANGNGPPRPPVRSMSTRSTSHWKSTVNLAENVDMKTEDLLDYIQRKPNTPFSRRAKHFLLCIALCHTCLPEKTDDGDITFQAASPDELALVEAAKDLGFLVIDRPAQAIKLEARDTDGSLYTETYQVLDVIEFSSKRKRMSIIIRMPDGRICVFCKGADNVIQQRLKLSNLAEETARDIGRRSSQRRASRQDMALQRMNSQKSVSPYGSPYGSPRNSFGFSRGESSNREGLRLSLGRRSTDLKRLSQQLARSPRASTDMMSPISPGQSFGQIPSFDDAERKIDESMAANEGAVFEKCFQHVDDFASEGLRTLLYAYRYIDEDSYRQWKEKYREAETSLVDRQERIEAAGELIEERFELAGATAIEDKLQVGVPDTIDKLRRANIKVWMLTGDKRETAINIGHSARVCKPWSEIYILDATLGELKETLTMTLNDVSRGMIPHSVVVVDGQTLAKIDEDDDLSLLFYDLVVRVDSVICCRASPSQKTNLVRSIRRYVPKSMTLAIGDGANDIGMIQASHVGIGISGREGLQASRISDYSIAQFRFLQKLLFVHGRWNYLRTGKYVLATFWKEILFFIVQAHYQRYNGYSGTSLYESWSLTVFNSAFTSLPVILLGIFEKDLRAETLMKVPELYTFGQRNLGFRFSQYFAWMFMGVAGSFVIWYFTWCVYDKIFYDQDSSIFAMGMVSFTVAVIFINIKLLILEVHTKTIVTFGGCLLSVAGWFLWMLAISGAKPLSFGPYIVRDAFIKNFGRTLSWWTLVLLELIVLVVIDLVVQAIRRVYFPGDQDLMQRIEKDGNVDKVFGDGKDAEEGGAEAEERVLSNEPTPGSERVQDRRHYRVSHDDYQPQFPSTAEERENPMEQWRR